MWLTGYMCSVLLYAVCNSLSDVHLHDNYQRQSCFAKQLLLLSSDVDVGTLRLSCYSKNVPFIFLNQTIVAAFGAPKLSKVIYFTGVARPVCLRAAD